MATITCPNCGAPSDNHEKCDFCGALITNIQPNTVGITTSSQNQNKIRVYPEILKELKENIETQEIYKDEPNVPINTIIKENIGSKTAEVQFFRTRRNNNVGLLMIFEIDTEEEYNALENLSFYKKLENDESLEKIYYCDFGTDYSNAARAASEVMQIIFKVSSDDTMDYCYTEIKEDSGSSEDSESSNEIADFLGDAIGCIGEIIGTILLGAFLWWLFS